MYCTRSPATANREAGLLFARHRLRVLDRLGSFDARANVADLSGVGVNYVAFGSAVEIDRPATDSYVGVIVPIAGRLTLHRGARRFTATADGTGGVLLGADRVRMTWSAECRVLSFRVGPDRLDRHVARLAPSVDAGPIAFGTTPLTGHPVATLLGLARMAVETFDRCGADEPPATVVTQLRDTVLTTMLLSLPHSHARVILHGGGGRRRRAVDAARELIDAECDGAELRVTEIALRVGVGLWALELGFRRDLDTTPAQYLRAVRLRRAHEELLVADPGSGAQVQAVAQKWGFFHTGRFSRIYRQRFGEYPSLTLMRSDAESSVRPAGGAERLSRR